MSEHPLTGGNAHFRRASRLTQAVEFRRVFARPRVFRDRYFRVLCRRNDLDRARLGLAVSKKNCPRATGRNRLKRVIRESFRRHQETLGEAPGLDIVVLPQREAATMCNRTLGAALEQHWARCATFARQVRGEASDGKD